MSCLIKTIKAVRAGLPHGHVHTHVIYARNNRDLITQAAQFVRDTARRLGVSPLALDWEIV